MDPNDRDNLAAGPIDQDSNPLGISDVIDAIEVIDPEARVIIQGDSNPQENLQMAGIPSNAFVEITEQPAQKGIRFRYLCEGRSAGSIPGENSTPENKTYPSIKIHNWVGNAVAVVSCVTVDEPYRPHPHSLVGKESSCKQGICTAKINNDTMTATFNSLGIQCVKKKEVDEALRLREKVRVDPFRTGYSHRSQPSSIDLNAIRLCFQVFLECTRSGGTNFMYPLVPVVSNPIFDKKAMSDLVICKLSKPSSSFEGGEEIILLCEKVAKEDIAVRFYEECNGSITWEGFGDFQQSNVHKQVAISFRTPRFRTLNLDHPVECFIQLQKPSNRSTSDPLPFTYYPLQTGRRSLLELRKNLKAKGNYEQLSQNLHDATSLSNGIHKENEQQHQTNMDIDIVTSNLNETNIATNMDVIDSTEKTSEWLNKTEFTVDIETPPTADTVISAQSNFTFNDPPTISPIVSRLDGEFSTFSELSNEEDKTLNELLEQVAELDEIYSGYQMSRNRGKLADAKIGNANANGNGNGNGNVNDSFDFDDTATYTSLQRAFKNPILITEPETEPELKSYDIGASNALAPIIDVSPLKRNEKIVEEEKRPPLPPKRLRKLTAENTEYNANLMPPTINNDGSIHSQIIIKRSPENRSPASSTTNSAQSSPQKKQGFFSRIFRRKSKSDGASSNDGTDTKNSPNLSRESSLTNFDGFDRNRLTTRSCKMPQSPVKKGKPVGRSVSSVSGKRPHLTADIVHIPLKGLSSEGLPMRSGSGNLLPEHYSSNVTLSNNLDRKTVSALQLADIPLQDGGMELVAIADAQSLKNLCEGAYGVHLDDDVDLSEAEHFALYTSAPHATQSEFDEMSAFYAPIEAAEAIPNEEIARRLALSGKGHNEND